MAAATSGTGFDRAGALRRQANVRACCTRHAGGGQPPFQALPATCAIADWNFALVLHGARERLAPPPTRPSPAASLHVVQRPRTGNAQEPKQWSKPVFASSTGGCTVVLGTNAAGEPDVLQPTLLVPGAVSNQLHASFSQTGWIGLRF